MKLEKKSINKKNKKDLSKPDWTCQIHDSDHEIEIALWEGNKKNYEAQFRINTILKDKIKKQLFLKITIKIIKIKFDKKQLKTIFLSWWD